MVGNHSQLANPDFNGKIDYTPNQVFGPTGKQEWSNVMTGNWAWKQAVSGFCNFVSCRSTHAHFFSGHYFQGSSDSWLCICSCHTWQWQDNGFSSYWPKQVLSSLWIDWKCTQHRSSSPPGCTRSYWISFHTKKYVFVSPLLYIKCSWI